ncbi:COG1470 family protein [Thermococcus pacificus]|uniref:Uncharacterized protein n=1 Tax=Thermococcus pacificus TaxID=71998 RepID=A0A218P9T1_9EURY|nr:hypothetical protein [Thermococcus pacificus]ASJ07539.1 hypothetical protein A3L08_09515 [Thermococcus pacificus]
MNRVGRPEFLVLMLILISLSSEAMALSVEMGLDEVLLVDGQVVTFDVANGGSLILLHVDAGNRSYSPVLRFGENLTVDGVTYAVGSFDPSTLRLRLHVSGNYSSVRVMKKHDFDVKVIEAFDTYVKLNVTSNGFYPLNGTLKVYSGGILLKEVPIELDCGESILLKLSPPSSPLTLVMEEQGISKTVSITKFDKQVSIERIWSNGSPVVELFNRGDPVNATVKLLYNGLTAETKRVELRRGSNTVAFSSPVAQGMVLVDYGALAQESFYLKPALLVLDGVQKNRSVLVVRLRNAGEVTFRGTVSALQNGVIVGNPLSRDVEIKPGELVEVEFEVPSDASYLTLTATSEIGGFSFPVMLGSEGIQVEAQSGSIRVPLGGRGAYILMLKGSGRVRLGIEGLPESMHYSFYAGESEIRELNVDGAAQVSLVLTVPNLPSGFSLGEPITFNVTVYTDDGTRVLPLELEVYGLGLLPVYGDNWLAKMNYTAETHFVGIPYRFAGADLTPPLAFEEWPGEKIAIAYGEYVQQGADLTVHVLSKSGGILHSSEQRKGMADYVVFNETDFMLMLEGDRFRGILLVADYMNGPGNLSFEVSPKEFGTGIRTFIINATGIRGKRLNLKVHSDSPVEIRAYYFTLNDERKDFDPLSSDFKGVFRGRGTSVEGSVNIRPYEDFIAVSIVGAGNVSIEMVPESVPVQAGGLGKYAGYLLIAGLLVLLGLFVYLERRLG